VSAGSIFAKFSIVVGVAALTAGGIFAWRAVETQRARTSDLEARASLASTELLDCKRARDTEHDTRESSEKASAELAAHLDASRTELEELRVQRVEADKRLAAFKTMTEKFRKMIDSGKLQVVIKHGRMIVKLPAGILFASGSADLSKEGQSALNEVAAILKQFPDRRFMIAGHTDNVPVVQPSPFKSNLDLSTSRALTVATQLIAAGMNGSRLLAAGYAEFEPARENTTEAGRQENRRIEIVLLPNLAELPPMPGEVTDAGARPADAGAAPAKPSR
jgi:chemotaxis protein MotB